MELMMDEIIRLALKEDIGAGDITTLATVAEDAIACGELVTRQDGIACGLEVCARCFALLDPAVRFEVLKRDGEPIFAGETIARVSGPARSILSAERTALNFLQRLCAVATKAHQTRALVPAGVRVVDTRKTTPGLRALEKYAVRCGGCENHRFNLADGVLIKDNHIRAAGSIAAACAAARSRASFLRMIEVECETLGQVDEALAAGADIIMLDNMELPEIRRAVARIGGRAIVEASGNMESRDLRAIAEAGVDVISIGGLTHSVAAMDISLEFC